MISPAAQVSHSSNAAPSPRNVPGVHGWQPVSIQNVPAPHVVVGEKEAVGDGEGRRVVGTAVGSADGAPGQAWIVEVVR